MPRRFQVQVSSRFQREARRLLKQHPELGEVLGDLRDVLQTDRHNRTREHGIRKLAGVGQGEGQWRIRVGDYRLRYDIIGSDVVLYSFRHRRDVY